ncbi:MAG: four helix bundle protein [Pyrinomonadaceae bacterium]
MATFKRFEDIKAWQKARRLTSRVYNVTGSVRFAQDFGLRNQIQRASVSVMANIAEGFGRHSDKEFANFLSVAHASVSEVQSHLYIALDLRYISVEAFKELYNLLEEIGKMTFVLAAHLRKPPRN